MFRGLYNQTVEHNWTSNSRGTHFTNPLDKLNNCKLRLHLKMIIALLPNINNIGIVVEPVGFR